MLASLKAPLRPVLLHPIVWTLYQRVIAARDLRRWERTGRSSPPPHCVKQRILAAHATAFEVGMLVETGTYLGDMAYAMRRIFRQIITIELSIPLYERAKRRFRKSPNIALYQGDSADMLSRILANISEPCLFWLDAHYSAGMTVKGETETPVVRELKAILQHRIENHVILIDDARCFGGTRDYPTVEEIGAEIAQSRPGYDFYVLHDVIRAHPKRSSRIEI